MCLLWCQIKWWWCVKKKTTTPVLSEAEEELVHSGWFDSLARVNYLFLLFSSCHHAGLIFYTPQARAELSCRPLIPSLFAFVDQMTT